MQDQTVQWSEMCEAVGDDPKKARLVVDLENPLAIWTSHIRHCIVNLNHLGIADQVPGELFKIIEKEGAK